VNVKCLVEICIGGIRLGKSESSRVRVCVFYILKCTNEKCIQDTHSGQMFTCTVRAPHSCQLFSCRILAPLLFPTITPFWPVLVCTARGEHIWNLMPVLLVLLLLTLGMPSCSSSSCYSAARYCATCEIPCYYMIKLFKNMTEYFMIIGME
jgi:hypothetical protein